MRIVRVALTVILALCTASAFSAKPPAQAPRGSNSLPATEGRDSPQRMESAATVVQQETEAAMPVADKRFVGTDGYLDAVTSWSPSGVPTAGDSWFFDGSSQYDVVSGLTTFTAVDTQQIWLQSAYQGNVGADGNGLQVPVGFLIHNGSGSLYHRFITHGSLATNIFIDSPNLQDAYMLASGGDANCILACIRGKSYLLGGAGPLSCLFVGATGWGGGTIVDIGASFGNVTYYRQSAGTVTTKSDLGTSSGSCVIDGGTLVYDATSADPWAKMDITGGYVQHNGTGTLGLCIVASGVLDMTQDSRAKTIGVLVLMPGANFLTHKNIAVGHLYDYRVSPPIMDGSLP